MKTTLLVTALILAGLGALGLRVVLEGRAALTAGDRAATEGRIDDAIASWESAARWYLPGVPHVDDAYERLRALASADAPHALAAWRAVRSAALATRSLWTPHADDLMTANAEIAERSSRDPEGAAAGGPDAATRKVWHVTQLARDPRPRVLGAGLSLLGIVTWLVGIAILLRRGISDNGRLIRRRAIIGLLLTAIGIAEWAVGLYNA